MTQENIIISINVEDEHEDGDDFMILDYVNDFLSEAEAEVEDLRTPHILDYAENYTVKELILICDYYGFSKEIKATKLGKDILIQCLVDYELDPVNSVNVEKRRNMWFFINELKNDKFMKKFVLW
jgi:hypothetical protein